MFGMDLEGIGALGAAAVALIGVPVTVLVGRWQLKAALRAEAVANETGMAQAASAYRAALDAVRVEANETRLQWRRGVQQETYSSFLLAAHRLRELGERFVADSWEELPEDIVKSRKSAIEDSRAALKAARTIVDLEGPDEVAASAAAMADIVECMISHNLDQAFYAGVQAKLARNLRDSSPAANSIVDLCVAISRLRAGVLSLGSPEKVYDMDALEESCYVAWREMPPGQLNSAEFRSVLEGCLLGFPERRGEYFAAKRQSDDAEVEFIRAARVVLHGQTVT